MNERQVTLLNRLLDGFEGKLTTSKWTKIAKCSPDTALRDINELLAHGVLRKTAAGGHSTHYELNESSKGSPGNRHDQPGIQWRRCRPGGPCLNLTAQGIVDRNCALPVYGLAADGHSRPPQLTR